MFKLSEWRRKSRAERLAAGDGDAKVEEPYVDDVAQVQQSPTTETVAANEDDVPPTPPKSSPPADD